MRWKWLAVAPVLAMAAIWPAMAGAGADKETQDVAIQGGGGVYAADAATLIRTSNGLNITVTIPTPKPGSYLYPGGAVEGSPEVFTGWAIVFNYPDMCSGPCDGDDLGADKPAKGGVYNIAGHMTGGSTLTMSGHVSVGQAPFAFAPLQLPATADVHIAIAPHGQLDPSQMPAQISTPIGGPPVWWVALFE